MQTMPASSYTWAPASEAPGRTSPQALVRRNHVVAPGHFFAYWAIASMIAGMSSNDSIQIVFTPIDSKTSRS